MPSALLEKRKPQPDTIPHSGHPPTKHAEEHKYPRPAESHGYGDDGERSGVQLMARFPALHKGNREEDSYAEWEDTEWSVSDDSYDEYDNGNDNATASDASSLATQMSQLSYGTNRRASAKERRNLEKKLGELSETTAPKRKPTRAQPASAEGKRLRKRVKVVVETSSEDSDEDSDEESDEEEAAKRTMNRPAKGRARGKKSSGLPVLPSHSSKGQRWTTKEEEILFNLQQQGKSWKYIGENALGRTAKAVRSHWEILRTESIKPVKTLSRRVRRAHNTSVLSAMARMGKHKMDWSEEEDNILISLRAQGKTIKYISGRIRGRSINACKSHWLKIKHWAPQTATTSDDLESDETEDSSEHSPFFPVRRPGQDAKEPESHSRPAVAVVVRQKYPQSRRHRRSSSWPK